MRAKHKKNKTKMLKNIDIYFNGIQSVIILTISTIFLTKECSDITQVTQHFFILLFQRSYCDQHKINLAYRCPVKKNSFFLIFHHLPNTQLNILITIIIIFARID